MSFSVWFLQAFFICFEKFIKKGLIFYILIFGNQPEDQIFKFLFTDWTESTFIRNYYVEIFFIYQNLSVKIIYSTMHSMYKISFKKKKIETDFRFILFVFGIFYVALLFFIIVLILYLTACDTQTRKLI